MNYIDLLTQEEKSILCEIITGREFKELFKRNEKEFSKIRKGFRAKSLSESLALSTAKTYIDKPFIAVWVNTRVDNWIKEIQNNIEKLEKEGASHDTAMATTMLDSFFAEHVDLYFKFTEKPLDGEGYSKLCERMDHIKSERVKNAEVNDRINAMSEENRRLSEQIDAIQQGVDAIKAEYEQKIQQLEQEKDLQASLLTKAQEKITELQTAPTTFKCDDADYLSQFDDTDTAALPSLGSDEIVSLCSVVSDYNGQKWLIRSADLDNNGCYYIFHKNEDLPSYFTNRDKIFYKDGPSDAGFFGIWTWSAVPNENDPSKDYILSHYNTKIDVIEIVTITEASDLNSLVNLLKDGIEYQSHSRRTMFSYYASNGQYVGILCNAKELICTNGKTTFVEECVVVPVYEFLYEDILRLNNGLSFYRNAFAGLPEKLYSLKEPHEIVKNIVLSSFSWAAYKGRGIIRTEYRTFKEFLGAIPVDNITCKIAAACRCSNSAAKELLDEFLDSVWKYIDGDSLEDKVILSAISTNSDLQEKTKALIRKDWEKENENLLTEAQDKIDSLAAELKAATAQLTEAQKSFDKIKAEEDRLVAFIAEKEKLAEDVEKSVAERIQRARENAADFIANMAFIGGQKVQITESFSTVEVPLKSVDAIYHTHPALADFDNLEAHHSWTDVIDTVAFELGEAGVAEQYIRGLAAFFCAAYIEKQPLLLVGPNATDIAQAFSASVAAHKHGTLYCDGSYSNQAIAEIGADGENIVIINNLITSSWMNRLPEILSQKDIFYMTTHPYAEDIQVEPKSLYGFMLPLFTEFFVDRKASGEYYGGYFADDFEKYSISKDTFKELKILSRITLSSLVRKRINALIATMHGIYSGATVDEEFLFAILPIAYASLAMNELIETISDPQKDFTISASLKRELQYVLGEI